MEYQTLTVNELRMLVGLAAQKARHLGNYVTTLEIYDEEDKAFIATKLAEMVFYQNLRDKLEKIINEK